MVDWSFIFDVWMIHLWGTRYPKTTDVTPYLCDVDEVEPRLGHSVVSTAVQSQKAVTAYFLSKQILPLGFAGEYAEADSVLYFSILIGPDEDYLKDHDQSKYRYHGYKHLRTTDND